MVDDIQSTCKNTTDKSMTPKSVIAKSRRQFLVTGATVALSAFSPWNDTAAAGKAHLPWTSKRIRGAMQSFVPARYQTIDLVPSEQYVIQARNLVNQHNYWDALPYLEQIQLADFEPSLRSLILVLFARALVGTGSTSLARQKLTQAIALDPSNVDGYIGLSWVELLLGDLAAATQTVRIGRGKRPDDESLRLITAFIAREKLRGKSKLSLPFGQEWRLSGKGIVCCSCTTPCPCRSNGLPTCGKCEEVLAVQIDSGYYGKVVLNGFTYCLSDKSEQPNSPLLLQANHDATDEQIIALERIFQSFNPLNPFAFLHVTRVPISLTYTPRHQIYNVEIPGRLHMMVKRDLNNFGTPRLLTAAVDYYANIIEYAKNMIYIVRDDLGHIRWDYSGHQANIRTIALDSSDYRDGKMLIQFADGSGFFNKKQMEIIKASKLPMLPDYSPITKVKCRM